MKLTTILTLLLCCTLPAWSIEKFNLVPVYGDAYWTDSLPTAMRDSYIRAAEQQLGKPWMNTNVALFSLYRAEGDREKYQQFVYKKRNQLAALAMGELMEARGRFLPEVLNGVFALCEETWWGLPAHYGPNMPLTDNQSLDLFNAETAGLVAWVLYLYEEPIRKFSPQLERRIRSEIHRRVIQEARRKREWWRGAAMNWNPWICSNWIACVLFGETDAAEQEKDLKLIAESLTGFVKGYPDDGGCDEGPSYWDRAAGSLFDCMHLLRAVQYDWMDPSWEGKVRRMADYFCKVNIGNGYFVNFADAGPRVGVHLTWFPSARMLGNEELMSLIAQSAEERHFFTDPAATFTNNYFYSLARELMLLMDVRELERQRGEVRLHFDSCLDRIQVMTARSRPNSTEGLYLAAKGGHNGESHNHNDVGNLIVYADGRPLIIDVGVGTYRKETFDNKTRYDIWCMQSNYHNVPLINGVAQRNGKEFAAREAKATFDKRRAVFSVDIAGAYPREAGVRRWQRTFDLARGKQIRVTERYELAEVKAPSSIVLMTQAKPQLEKGKVVLTTDGKRWAVVYDEQQLEPIVEQVELGDKKFEHLWGTVYRTRLTLRSNRLAGEVVWTVVADKTDN